MKKIAAYILMTLLLLGAVGCRQADPSTPPQGTHAETGEPNTETETDTDTNAATTDTPSYETDEPTSESESRQETEIPTDAPTEPSHSEGETESASDDAYCIAPRRYNSWEEFLEQWPITGKPTQYTGVKETALALPVLKSDKYELFSIEETAAVFVFWYKPVDYTPEHGVHLDYTIAITCRRDDWGYETPTFGRSYPYRAFDNLWRFYENDRNQDIKFYLKGSCPATLEEFYEIFEFKIFEFPNVAEISPTP